MRKGLVFALLLGFNFLFVYGINYANKVMFENDFMIYLNKQEDPTIDNPNDPGNVEEEIVNTNFDGESVEVIGKKIDRLLNKTAMEGMGEYIAKAAIFKSVNPYLIGGIILESTNCKIDCSILLKQCNNVSGYKDSPGCFGGSYKKYKTLEEGISDLVNRISTQFYTKEMQAPLKMFKAYGKDEVWAFKVSKYMEELKRGK